MVACSATESTNGFDVVRKGLIEFRYLKSGNFMIVKIALVDITAIPAIIMLPKSASPFRNFFSSLLNFWTIIQITKNAVEAINEKPPKPKTNDVPGLSNARVQSNREVAKTGIAQIMNPWSFLRKGKAKKNNPRGSIKYWIPPQEDRPKAIIIPPPTSLTRECFLFPDFMALKNR